MHNYSFLMYVIHFLAKDIHNVIYLSYKIIKGDNKMFKEISAKELKETHLSLLVMIGVLLLLTLKKRSI